MSQFSVGALSNPGPRVPIERKVTKGHTYINLPTGAGYSLHSPGRNFGYWVNKEIPILITEHTKISGAGLHLITES